jgi:large subunit ribosomal protein L15
VRQHELRPSSGARHARKRVGRGNASGHGTYSGRGLKGQKARAGGGVKPGFEGGQLPLVQRMARKRGFTNYFRIEYEPVNLSRLSRFPAGSEVTPETLLQAGLVKDRRRPIKVLGDGNLSAALTVRAHKFSASARQKIEAAGGKVEEVAR